MTGLGRPKSKKSSTPAETGSMDSTPIPSWMTGEAPTPPPRKKKLKIDSGGQLTRGSDKLA